MNADMKANLMLCLENSAEVAASRSRDDQRRQAVIDNAASLTGDEFIEIATVIEELHARSVEKDAGKFVMVYDLALIGWGEVFESLLARVEAEDA